MKKPTDEMLNDWKQMTEENLHKEVRLEIADWFAKQDEYVHNFDNRNYPACFDYFLRYECRHEFFPYELTTIYLNCTALMLADIRSIDEEIGNEINKCL